MRSKSVEVLAYVLLATALVGQHDALGRHIQEESASHGALHHGAGGSGSGHGQSWAAHARAVNKLLWHKWNIKFNSTGPELVLKAQAHNDWTSQLRQVLDLAGKLTQEARDSGACDKHSNSRSGSSDADRLDADDDDCPAAAPELMQGGTAAFLATILRNYPQGPTSRDDLIAWAKTATSFLQGHRRLQLQQRQAAAEIVAAKGVRATAAAKLAATPTPAANAADPDPEGEGGEAEGSGLGADDPSSGGGGGGGGGARRSAAGSDSRRKLQGKRGCDGRRDAKPGHGGNGRGGEGGGTGSSSSREVRGLADTENGDGAAAAAAAAAQPQFPANFTAVQYGGLPLVRRVLLAQLMLRWMTGPYRERVGSPHLATVLSELANLLYDIHVESVAQRSLAEYFHISKAGGTSWATAANANQCRNPRATAARVPDFDDECRWIDGDRMRELGVPVVTRPGVRQVCSRFDVPKRLSPFRDCEGRWRHAMAKGYQYIANEYTLMGGLHDMHGTHICPQFVNVISIRDPLARLSSNIKYTLVRLRSVLFSKKPASDVFNKVFCNAPASLWEEYAPPVADNYNIRTLVGERGFHAPLYGIGEAHEAIAKQLLLQYDLILDLNAGGHAADLLMKEGLGWNKTLAEVHTWSLASLARQSGLDLENGCPVGDLSPLLEKQVYDQRWYSFGRILSRLDQLFLSTAAQLGKRPWPRDWAAAAASSSVAGEGKGEGRLLPAASPCGLLGASKVLLQQRAA